MDGPGFLGPFGEERTLYMTLTVTKLLELEVLYKLITIIFPIR